MSPRPKVLVGLLGLGLTVATLSLATPAPAQANPAGTGLVINEVYGAGGNAGAAYNADFVELYNPTANSIPLTGLAVHYRSAAGGSGGSPFALSGSVPAGSTWLIQMSGTGANGSALPTPDATATPPFSMATAGGQIALQEGTTVIATSGNTAGVAGIVDFFGAAGAASHEGTPGPAATAAQSVNRSSGADTDVNSADFTLAAPSPTAAIDEGSELDATSEADVETTVDVAMTPVVLEATGGTPPYTWTTASTLPAGVTLSTAGELSGTPTETGVFEITATVTDDEAATDNVTFTLTVEEPAESVTIAEIQGTGNASPLEDDAVTVQGVVTASYPTGGLNGFFMQTPGADATPGASDGIFVFTGGPFDESTLVPGDSVEVAGTVDEFNGLTEIVTVTSVTEIADLGDVVANEVIPGTDCALPGDACLTGAALDAAKEELEGEVFQPTGDFTVTDVFDGSAFNPPNSGSSSFFGEIGLAANSTEPLITPTEVIDAQATADRTARIAYNNAHRVILDDGSSTTYWNTTNTAAGKDTPMPWFTPTNQVRVGAAATFDEPVILDFRFGWKVQPISQVTDDGADQVSFEQNRPTEPEDVGGDIKIGTFNVLNYFTTLGVDYDAGPGSCTSFPDRAGNPIAVNQCTGNGPRGAWDATSFGRQETKIVNAINALDADIVSVEEIENSLKVDGHDRDEALSALVDALNTDAGSTVWDFVPSPAEASDAGNIDEQDVIRTGFIYKPGAVELVGASDMLFDDAAFVNAREPFAQAFKVAGTNDAQGFAVIVNHFKSKGCSGSSGDNVDAGDGQSCYNGDRTRQADALSTFATDFAAARGVDGIFLAGDFNAASMEDPMQVLYADGYEGLDAEGEYSYSFDGQSQSLDHVLANEAAAALVTGVDIWEVNANETVFNQYSRYNYNATILYDEAPFSASDHNPEIVGITAPEAEEVEVQILGTNDFHGRLVRDETVAGLHCDDTQATPPVGPVLCPAAVLSSAVKSLRAANPNTVFAAAGDLIGATTFESFVQNDEPTIDALNEAGLEVSAAGNHEFDQGYEDLVGRVQNLADWEYIAANVEEPEGRDDLAETWTKTIDGVDVGFVGAVTEDLPALVSPDGIEGVTVTDIVDATNAAAADLKTAGADMVVLLVHEGSPSTSCASPNFTDESTVWGNITQNTSADVDAIISGHTHLAYNCSFPVQEWVDEDRAVTERPVVSSGQYGQNLNQLVFTVDAATGDVTAKTQSILALTEANYPEDPAVVQIVEDAIDFAFPIGQQVLGEIEAPFNRAKLANGTTENRGGESTLGNLVAEVQREQTPAEQGGAQIAFMNPGGLRADMVGTLNGDDRELTYRQAANVQPFANGLTNMDMTGAQIETVLEQQWQRTADGPSGTVPSRPFLRLGVSEGFTYTYVETPVTVNGTPTFEGEITGMWLDGVAIDPATSYSVTVNSFLASGGDNFRAFAAGTGKAQWGITDLQAMVTYMDENTGVDPLPVDYSQRAVEVENVAGSYTAGENVEFDVASWTMSAPGDVKDTEIQVKLGDEVLGTATLDNTIGTDVFDRYGTAHVNVELPDGTPAGPLTLMLVGPNTGTEIPVEITVDKTTATVTGEDVSVDYGQGTTMHVTVEADGVVPTGTVTLKVGDVVLGTGTLVDGATDAKINRNRVGPGVHTVTIEYSGDGSVEAAEGEAELTVDKATPTVVGTRTVVEYGQSTTMAVRVGASGVVPSGQVVLKVGDVRLGSGTLTDGVTAATIGARKLPPGTYEVTIRYDGDEFVEAATGTATLVVKKATPTVVAPNTSMVFGETGSMLVKVKAPGVVPTGTVRVFSAEGLALSATTALVDGQAVVTLTANKLPASPTPYVVTVKYSGDEFVKPGTDTANLRVKNP